jgi:OmpA-OmpF porin, OOP family
MKPYAALLVLCFMWFTSASVQKMPLAAEPNSLLNASAEVVPAQAASSTASAQPNLVSTKIEFIPGEKTIFYDDFSDMPPGEPPPHWKLRGPAAELRMGVGLRELWFPTTGDETELTSGHVTIPKNFTFEVVVAPNPAYQSHFDWEFQTATDDNVLKLHMEGGGGYGTFPVNAEAGEDIGQADPKVDQSKPIHVALWMQDGRLRVYENGERVIDANQVELKQPIDHIHLETTGPIGFRSVRIAESAPDPAAVLAGSGKFVTHGIYFDTDSDVLKPESAPVIKAISNALYKNPGIKVEIDGYTDSTGDAAHNLDLSKRRAQAVMKVLVSQFGIDQSRLRSNGFGAAKPIASNDTAEGRAENRRVEFVKQGANTSGSSGGGAAASEPASPGSAPAPGAEGGTNASASGAPLSIPEGTRLFPAYSSGSKNYLKLKPGEQVAYLLLLSIRSLEKRCNDELNRTCSLVELVKGVKGSEKAFNGPIIGLTVNPARDPSYRYTISKAEGGYQFTAEPRRSGLGGFLDDEGIMGGIYFSPNGAATKNSQRLKGNGWGVGPHAQGGDFERGRS